MDECVESVQNRKVSSLCFLTTDYLCDEWELVGPTVADLRHALKYSLIFFDKVIVDRPRTEVQELLALVGLSHPAPIDIQRSIIGIDEVTLAGPKVPYDVIQAQNLIRTIDQLDQLQAGLTASWGAYLERWSPIPVREIAQRTLTTEEQRYAEMLEPLVDAAEIAILSKDERWAKHTPMLRYRAIDSATRLLLHVDAAKHLGAHLFTPPAYLQFIWQISDRLAPAPSVVSAPTVFLRMFFPAPDQLSWADIITLRDSSYRSQFQKTYIEDTSFDADAAEDVSAFVIDSLYRALRKNKPKRWGSIFARSLSALPVPLLGANPLASAREVADGVREAETFRMYGWLFFLAEAAALAQQRLDGSP